MSTSGQSSQRPQLLQAAAAAHSLGTPLSTIKIISQDLYNQFKDKKDLKKDLELLVSQVNRCKEILKRLTLNPIVEDEFIDQAYDAMVSEFPDIDGDGQPDGAPELTDELREEICDQLMEQTCQQ